ncbi:MAG: VCBS repeat-containing protein [Flavobacteriales bacterium]|nr:VCBS repeat-containing protein [Flavobacteriales bacterium]
MLRPSTPALAPLIALALIACDRDAQRVTVPAATGPLLRAVPADESGITFANTLNETPELNYFTYVYAYNGGGVAVGDIDNDGLPDIYFTGNVVPDRLYRNLGGLKFEDITAKAIGPLAGAGWRNGVAMADVNGDGWLDIYVCRSGPSRDTALTRNLLYLNNGDGSFSERAHAWGVADTTHSTQAAFVDHDGDGDLDLYVMNTPPDRLHKFSNFTAFQAVREKRAPTDRLYRNEGGHFTDVTYAADVQNFTYGLGLSVGDLDLDGRPDIYTACDFDSPDLMYMNTGTGTFKEEAQRRLRHMSNFGMGSDAADYDNDGLPDLVVLDMTAPDHLRNKTNMGSMSPERFWANVRGGYFFQYMVNTLQRNNGNGTFSEVGQLAGIARTDWSWAPLFADLDNDGWKDLLVTNGFKHDVRDNDFQRAVYDSIRSGADFFRNLDLIPSTRLHNYLFRNDGADDRGHARLTFSDSTKAWGFTEPVNSNGAAYADLDGDGDLDLVINNLDEAASLFENRADQVRPQHHHLRVEPRDGKLAALGTRVVLRDGGKVQAQELYPVRGYQSCVEPVLHFGLGTRGTVDSVEIFWPGDTYTLLRDVKAGQLLRPERKDAGPLPTPQDKPAAFADIAPRIGLDWTHREDPYNDFALEVLLPHAYSALGPHLSTADADGDGRDDLFVSGAHGQSCMLFLQKADGSFREGPSQPWKSHQYQEHLGSCFFDADGDGDMDLLLLAGGNQHDLREEGIYRQRLYLNDGRAVFRESPNAFAADLMTSAMRADAADVDGDGDMDLFIGGRITPGHYPFPPRSYLLINDGKGRFIDATKTLAPAVMGPGLVTAVRFADLDADGDPDLALAGEWMPLMVMRNDGGRFTDITEASGLAGTSGWWTALEVADVNGDGRPDLIGGNLGWNSKFQGTPEKPVHVYWADFDDNGRSDIVLAKEKDGHLLPVRGRECSSQQCPVILERFPTYAEFARADLQQIYTPEKLERALHRKAEFMRSAAFLSGADGRYTASVLPALAQTAPVNAIVVQDLDGDGHADLFIAGNNWGAEVETVRYDAGTGLLLKGDGSGRFDPVPLTRSGLFAWGEVKDVKLLRQGAARTPLLVVANTSDRLQAFAPNAPVNGLSAR